MSSRMVTKVRSTLWETSVARPLENTDLCCETREIHAFSGRGSPLFNLRARSAFIRIPFHSERLSMQKAERLWRATIEVLSSDMLKTGKANRLCQDTHLEINPFPC